MMTDLRHALRLFVRVPGFAIVACLTLALGIGATTTVFSVVDAALFGPVPYADADRLVTLWAQVQRRGGGDALIDASGQQIESLRAVTAVFESIDALSPARAIPLAAGADDSLLVGGFTPSFPRFLGVGPQLGRAFVADDVARGEAIIISDGYWRRACGGSPSVLGKTIVFTDRTAVIVGVMPATFRFFVGAAADAWLPIADRDGEFLVARVRRGVSLERAQHDLDAALHQTRARGTSAIGLEAAGVNRSNGSTRTMLLCLLGAAGFVLVIACANVANMLLARTMERRREIAVRGALGAGRRRLLRQFLVEGLVLSASGGAAAVMAAWWSIKAIPLVVPTNVLYSLFGVSLPQLDLRVLAFGVCAAIVSGGLCGVVPAVHASRTPAAGGLLSTTRLTTGSSRGERVTLQTCHALQVAVTLVLLMGARLLLASFVRMAAVPVSYDSANLGYASLSFPRNGYDVERVTAYLDQSIARLEAVPRIRAVTSGTLPVSGYANNRFVPESPFDGGVMGAPLEWFSVRPDYFSVAGMPLLEGRRFGPDDRRDAAPVAIISQNAAARFWPGERAVGKRFRRATGGAALTVVGVVPHTRTLGVARDGVEVYLPEAQAGPSSGLLFRTVGDPAPTIGAVRTILQATDRRVRLVNIGMVSNLFRKDDPLALSRFYAVVVPLFAGVGLLTAAAGLYGLVSYAVSRRTQEIGIRLALGADASRVSWVVLAESLLPLAAGVAVGLVAAAWLSRFVVSQLFRVGPHDPMMMAGVVGLFATVCGAAVVGPVRRAIRIDPVNALRAE